MSQNRKILNLLKKMNGNGVTSLDIYKTAGSLNASSRIDELRNEGHIIECKWNSKHWKYYYISGPPTLICIKDDKCL